MQHWKWWGEVRAVITLARTPGDRELAPPIFVREGGSRGRPAARYHVAVDSMEALEQARRVGLPIYLLEPWVSKALGYPLSFSPRLLVGRAVADAVHSTRFPVISFIDSAAARNPRLEDVIVAMLDIDPLGARRILRLNLDLVDPSRLLKRILVEDREPLSTLVGLQEFVPTLPVVGKTFPASELAEEDAKEFGG